MKLKVDSKKQADYIVDEITKVCNTIGPREPGSNNENKACKYFQKALDKWGYETKIERFEQHPRAFYAFFLNFGFCVLLSCLAMFLFPLVGMIIISLFIIYALLQFGLYLPIIDKCYKKKLGSNLYGIKKCSKEPKVRIFFTGHIDSVWNFRINNKFGGKAFVVTVIACVIGLLYQLGICIALVVIEGAIYYPFMHFNLNLYFWLSISALAFLPFEIALLFIVDKKKIVQGANDNLTGCLNAIAVLKTLQENKVNLKHIEVGAILAGSEEAGLKGSKAWTKAHKDEYKDIPTYIFNFDSIHDKEWLMVNYRDLNCLVKTNKEAGDLFFAAAKQAKVAIRKGAMPPLSGSTDGAAYVRGGFKATSITGLTHSLGDYYHTMKDTPDNLNKEAIADCYKATMQLLQNFIDKYE